MLFWSLKQKARIDIPVNSSTACWLPWWSLTFQTKRTWAQIKRVFKTFFAQKSYFCQRQIQKFRSKLRNLSLSQRKLIFLEPYFWEQAYTVQFWKWSVPLSLNYMYISGLSSLQQSRYWSWRAAVPRAERDGTTIVSRERGNKVYERALCFKEGEHRGRQARLLNQSKGQCVFTIIGKSNGIIFVFQLEL